MTPQPTPRHEPPRAPERTAAEGRRPAADTAADPAADTAAAPGAERATDRPRGHAAPVETPPGEDSTGGAGPRETYNPARGWSVVPLALVLIVAVCFVVFFFSYALLL